MKGNSLHPLKPKWTGIKNLARKLIGIPRSAWVQNMKPLTNRDHRLHVMEDDFEPAETGYIWAAMQPQVTTDKKRIFVKFDLPKESFDQLVVRKIGGILHIEIEYQPDQEAQPSDPVEHFVTRRESSGLKVLRRAIPLAHVTEDPTWQLTEDYQLQIELRRSVTGVRKRESAKEATKPSGPKRSLKSKHMKKAKDG